MEQNQTQIQSTDKMVVAGAGYGRNGQGESRGTNSQS